MIKIKNPSPSSVSGGVDGGATYYSVHGHSLSGFHKNCSSSGSRDEGCGGGRGGLPVGLEAQISHIEGVLCKTVGDVGGRRDDVSGGDARSVAVKVILVGHSMGGYILLELIRRRHKARGIG